MHHDDLIKICQRPIRWEALQVKHVFSVYLHVYIAQINPLTRKIDQVVSARWSSEAAAFTHRCSIKIQASRCNRSSRVVSATRVGVAVLSKNGFTLLTTAVLPPQCGSPHRPRIVSHPFQRNMEFLLHVRTRGGRGLLGTGSSPGAQIILAHCRR